MLYKLAIVLGAVGIAILLVAVFVLASGNDGAAFTLVAVGLCCGIPAIVVLILLVFFHRVQRKQQVEHLYKGEDIETVIGNKDDEELAQNLQLIRESQAKEQEKFEAEETKLEQEISFLSIEIDGKEQVCEKEQEVIDNLEEERARLLEQREELEKDKAESEEFIKRQLESALVGKGQLDIMQAEKTRIALLLAEKEKKEKDRVLRAQQYADTRKENQQIKRALLGRQNIEVLVRKYFVEIAVCFLMNRDAYKDKFGLAPYNKVINSETGDKATHIMATTEDRFWRFAETLVDVERFLEHKVLYPAFERFAVARTPLVLISEKLHYMYLQKNTRKDFVKNYTYKEDFENLLVLVNNNYLMRGGLDVKNWEALGFKDFEEAMHIRAIHNDVADKSSKELVDAVLKKRVKK